jgi:hypothetical protein
MRHVGPGPFSGSCISEEHRDLKRRDSRFLQAGRVERSATVNSSAAVQYQDRWHLWFGFGRQSERTFNFSGLSQARYLNARYGNLPAWGLTATLLEDID